MKIKRKKELIPPISGAYSLRRVANCNRRGSHVKSKGRLERNWKGKSSADNVGMKAGGKKSKQMWLEERKETFIFRKGTYYESPSLRKKIWRKNPHDENTKVRVLAGKGIDR